MDTRNDTRIQFPLGIDIFSEIRKNGNYYVDKTPFIQELLNQSFKVNLITRPRRFGKTLTLSMLEDFFYIAKDSREDFEGLAISKDTELCSKWRNQWPVVFLSLKSVNGITFESAFGMLKSLIADICKKYAFLSNSADIDQDDRILYQKLKSEQADEVAVKNSLYLFTRMMYSYYGKQVILLVDEYDVPLAKAKENGYYREMLDVICALFEKSLKSNEFLKFAVITGCLKISKESIFTGTNHFVSDTITGHRFDEYIGFTESDVHQILEDAGFLNHAEEIRNWYDGYRFGCVEVYCPWDVLNHVAALQVWPNTPPGNYWEDTSHNEVIRTFIRLANEGEHSDLEVNDKFECLLAGGYIEETIEENLTYENVWCSESNLWSLLLLTGYLTVVSPTALPVGYQAERGKLPLKIPNEEVKGIFRKTVISWFQERIAAEDRSELFQAMWDGDAGKVTDLISDYLFSTISYHDYREDFYHAFVTGLFTGAGFIVKSNRESGLGRTDITIRDRKQRRAIILEAKYAKSEEWLEKECNKAIQQIDDRRYAEEFKKGYRTVLCYGIAFHDKQCLVKKFDKP